MKTRKELLREAARLREAMKAANIAIIAKEDAGEDAGDDTSSFDKLSSDLEAVKRVISRLESIGDDADDNEAKDADEDDVADAEKHYAPRQKLAAPAHKIADTVDVKRKNGDIVGRLAVGSYIARNFGARAAKDAVMKHWGDTAVAKTLTLNTAQPIIPQDFRNEVIDALVAESVTRKFARVMGMPMGQLTLPRMNLTSQGTWMAEGTNIATTAAGFDTLTLSWHKLGAMTYTSKELLEFSPVDAANQISTDLVRKMALAEDGAFLQGATGGFNPVGMTNLVNATNQLASTGGTSVTFQTVSYDLASMELALTGNNVRGRFVWIMSPRVIGFLKQVSSTFGVYPFREELATGKLNGFEVFPSNLLATNIGTGTNETLVILACADHLIIGDAYRNTLSSTDTGSFVDGANQVNPFGQDLVAFKLTNAVDFNMSHDVSAAVLTATDWTVGSGPAVPAYTGQPAGTAGSPASAAKSRS